MSLLNADHEIALRSPAAAGRHDVHRRRLQLRRPHRGRRPAALGRAARRVRGRGAQRFGGDPGPRRGRAGRVPADPGPDRGAGPARLRRAHLLLQDRRGVPVLAQRSPAAFAMVGGLHSARSLPHLSTLVRLADAAGRSSTPSSPPTAGTPTSRCTASVPAMTHVTAAVAEPGHDQVRRPATALRVTARSGHHEHRAVAGTGGRGRARRRRRHGRRLRAAGVDACAAGGSSPQPTTQAAGPRSTRTAGPSRRPRRWPRRAPRIGARAGPRRGWAARGDRDLPGARARARDAVGALVDDATAAGVVLAIEPMHPIYAADRGVISTLGQALDVAEQFPADGGRRRRRHLPRLVGPAARRAGPPGRPGRSDRELPGLRLDHPAPARRPARARDDGRRAHRLPRGHRAGHRGGLRRGRRGGDLQPGHLGRRPRRGRRRAPPRPSTPTSASDLLAAAP